MKRLAASFLPPIALDANGATPLYAQVSDWFRRAIIEGQLRPGQRVPSTRNLALELRISRIPVLSAYEQLHAEGYLETFTGAGTCVARDIPDDALRHQHPETKLPRAAAATITVEPAPRRVSQRVAALRTPPAPWLTSRGAFRIGVPALDQFPFELWAKLVSRHSRNLPLDIMGYGDAVGYLPLREAIAEYLGTVRGVRCDATQVVITTGSQQGLQICGQVLLDAKDRAWMEDPGYRGGRQALMAAGAKIIPVPVDQEGLDVAEGIRRCRNARAVYITPSHQFPLGTTMSAARRMQLLNWASRTGAWIIEDDYDSEFRFGGRPVTSLQGLDTDDRVIYVGTFSKVMFPAMRLGYVVVPKDLIEPFTVVRDAADTFSSTLYQLVMTDFIRDGHFARHIRRMRTVYMERRSAVLDAIDQYIGDRLEVIGADAGMQLSALLPHGIDDVEVTKKAAEKGVSVRPLSTCYVEPPQRCGLILGYGGTTTHEIREGIRKLGTCF